MTITPEDLVRREVHYCVSGLVATLAPHWGAMDLSRDQTGLSDLFEQAGQLAAPIDDWEEAAREHGAKITQLDEYSADAGKWIVLDQPEDSDMYVTFYDDARNAAIAYCDFHSLEPYQWEVYEHWIVSDWLADKLKAEGEKVDRDFAGLTVWARTTTGQAIAMDGVIERIATKLTKVLDDRAKLEASYADPQGLTR